MSDVVRISHGEFITVRTEFFLLSEPKRLFLIEHVEPPVLFRTFEHEIWTEVFEIEQVVRRVRNRTSGSACLKYNKWFGVFGILDGATYQIGLAETTDARSRQTVYVMNQVLLSLSHQNRSSGDRNVALTDTKGQPESGLLRQPH
ncbi:hypothetical protein Bbelb_179440 [Branchiostoma belcheri]|nr:hypothetical protein Bbelb_179440 [Branchiostoma belcheri]